MYIISPFLLEYIKLKLQNRELFFSKLPDCDFFNIELILMILRIEFSLFNDFNVAQDIHIC